MHAATIVAGALTLEPLRVGHAREMAVVLGDPSLHRFVGGSAPGVADLERRYAAQVVGRSPEGHQVWLNWIVRDSASGAALGYVQATVEGGTAELAWVVGSAFQGRGVARAAATAMVGWLRDHGVESFVAHVHPGHLASAAVARRLGLTVSGRLVDGEVEWTSPGEEPPVNTRSADRGDLDAVLPFWSVAAEDAHRPADSFDAVRRLVERDPDALQLATIGDVLAGTLIAGWDGWRCHLYRLAVHPTFRRRGIARLLVTAAEDRFAGLGARRVDAMVLDDNPDAHALWTGLGYARQAEWSRWVKPL